MWRVLVWRGIPLHQCFPIDIYDRDMTMDIWLILPYDRAWGKDLSYTWYMCLHTQYRAKYTKYRAKYSYTRDMIVFTRYKQVYKNLNRYILMACK